MTGLSKERVAELLRESPFIRFSGIDVESVDAEAQRIVLTMPSRPELMRSASGDMFHGGPIASFIDTAGDFAVALLTGGPVPTINFRVDYLRPATGSKLRAVAVVRKLGRTLATADVDILDEQGRLCAIGRGAYSAQVG